MSKKTGFRDSLAIIKSVNFPKEAIRIVLTDGRILILPLNSFPSIRKLTLSQRRKHKILAGTGLMFDDLDDVFHISDFIGKVATNSPRPYELPDQEMFSNVAESEVKYQSKAYKLSGDEIKTAVTRSQELKSGKVKGLSHAELVKSVKAGLKKAKKR